MQELRFMGYSLATEADYYQSTAISQCTMYIFMLSGAELKQNCEQSQFNGHSQKSRLTSTEETKKKRFFVCWFKFLYLCENKILIEKYQAICLSFWKYFI